jgi:putative zinc finger/helix-turn-helix YgiT family protein
MFVEIISESEEPGGLVKIVAERHRVGSSDYRLKRRLIRSADGTWVMTPKDARLVRKALATIKCMERGLPTPKQIKELRTALGFSQRQASRLFGSGPRSFQKYESGAEVTGTAMARLLWLVRRKPELVSELGKFVQW